MEKRHNRDLNVNAPPFDRNPSAWSQRVPIVVLAAVGFFISAYMALFQWGLIDTVWDPVFGDGTRKVLESDSSKKMEKYIRMPDAALGAIGYLSEVLFGLAGSVRRWQYRPWMALLFGFDVIPLGAVSIILVFVQGMVIGSWCFLCLVTAAISVLLIYFAYDETWASIQYLWRVWKKYRDWGLLWKTFKGTPTREADALALVKEI